MQISRDAILESDMDLSRALTLSIIIGTVLNFAGIVTRLGCRQYIKVPLMVDDWLVVASLLPLAGFEAAAGVQTTAGMGKTLLLAPDFSRFASGIIPTQIFYMTTFYLTKLSVLYFYQRIFPIKNLKILTKILMFTITAYTVACIIVVAVQCRAGTTQWTQGATGICISRGPAFKTFASLNAATNLAILVLPIKYSISLQMTLCRKLHVIAVFLVGTIICVVTLVRISIPMQTDPADTTLAAGESTLWHQIELAVAIFCACGTTYRPMCTMGSSLFFRAKTFTSSTLTRVSSSSRHSGMSEMILKDSKDSSDRCEERCAWAASSDAEWGECESLGGSQARSMSEHRYGNRDQSGREELSS